MVNFCQCAFIERYQDFSFIYLDPAKHLMGLFDDLHKSLTGKGPNPVPPEDGIKTIRIIEAALKSAEEGKVINF